MNSRELHKALRDGRMVTFVAAVVALAKGQTLALRDLTRLCQSLESHRKKFTPEVLRAIQPVVVLESSQLKIKWVMPIGVQGTLLSLGGEGFAQSILREARETVEAATQEALGAIDTGNDIVIDALNRRLTAREAKARLEAGPNPLISANIVGIANRPQASFAFCSGERDIAGNSGVPKEVSDEEITTLKGCKVVDRVFREAAELILPPGQYQPAISRYFRQGKPRIRVGVSLRDAQIIKCARFSGCSIDIDVTDGLRWTNKVEILHLARVRDWPTIVEAARARIDAIDETSKESNDTDTGCRI